MIPQRLPQGNKNYKFNKERSRRTRIRIGEVLGNNRVISTPGPFVDFDFKVC